jgi:hypothetical protein
LPELDHVLALDEPLKQRKEPVISEEIIRTVAVDLGLEE